MSKYVPQLHSSAFLTCHLNDRGAQFLEDGKYEEAISMLIRALELWQKVGNDEVFQYSEGELDECIEKASRKMAKASSSLTSSSNCISLTCLQVTNMSSRADMKPEDRFIYCHPIYAPPIQKDERRSPGITISLIIILNLAIAHHLSAIQGGKNRPRLQKALQLYELAHQLQEEDEVSSPRATLIIANNVGEIHRAVNNPNKHTLCLQHLLSTMMYIIDCQIPVTSFELEGFFRNTSQLILHDNCAGAA